MKSILCFLSALAVVAPGVLFAQSSGKTDGLAIVAALFEEHHEPEASGPALTLEDVERIALAANPEIAVAARRVAIAEAHVPVAGALDDPMAMYRGWGVPLSQPWNYNAGPEHVQHQPDVSRAAASAALRTSVAESDVDVAKAELEQVRLEVRVRVHKAFDDLLLIGRRNADSRSACGHCAAGD